MHCDRLVESCASEWFLNALIATFSTTVRAKFAMISQSLLVNPSLKIEIQLTIATTAHPIKPVKNTNSMTRIAQAANLANIAHFR
jgi:hypothetical protein